MKRHKPRTWTEWRLLRRDGKLCPSNYNDRRDAELYATGEIPIRVRVTEILPPKKRKGAK